MKVPATIEFRWRSLLGVATALFLLYGAMNALAAVFVPLSLHRSGPWAVGGLVFTEQVDTAVLGQRLTTLTKTDPALGAFLVAFMDTMCAYMMAFAILELGVVWFALRRAQMWALGAATLSNLVVLPYYVAIALTYVQFGVPLKATLPLLLYVGVLIPVAAILGWMGLRRGSRPRP